MKGDGELSKSARRVGTDGQVHGVGSKHARKMEKKKEKKACPDFARPPILQGFARC